MKRPGGRGHPATSSLPPVSHTRNKQPRVSLSSPRRPLKERAPWNPEAGSSRDASRRMSSAGVELPSRFHHPRRSSVLGTIDTMDPPARPARDGRADRPVAARGLPLEWGTASPVKPPDSGRTLPEITRVCPMLYTVADVNWSPGRPLPPLGARAGFLPHAGLGRDHRRGSSGPGRGDPVRLAPRASRRPRRRARRNGVAPGRPRRP